MYKRLFLVFSLLILIPFIWAGTYYLINDVSKLKKSYPHLKLDGKGQVLDVYFKGEPPSHWVPLKKMNEYAKWAIIVKEDWPFYEHGGVDFYQIFIAIRDHFVKGKRIRGASTISQQVIKNVFLSPKKTLWRKIKELILTKKLEKTLSKDKILEIYLNIVETGVGLYGVYDASKEYFNKHPRQLTPKEAAFIASLLPSPKRYSHSYRVKELSEYIKFEIDRVLIKLRQANIYTEEDRIKSVNECFFWEKNCFTDQNLTTLSDRIANPFPIKKKKDDEDTRKLQQLLR